MFEVLFFIFSRVCVRLGMMSFWIFTKGYKMFLSGKRPSHLGVKQGKLAAPSNKPNNVSSQADSKHTAFVMPLLLKGDAAKQWQQLQAKVAAMTGASIITTTPNYIHAEFKTPLMGFVDDVELLLDGKQVHVRSASRLGYSDWGVNRKRVEAIRGLLG
jgi:uncharacterized protein (DUF1499 family)